MRTLKRNLNILILATGVVLIWRGVWGLADTYLLPDTPLLSFVVSIVIGLLVLLALNPKNRDISELI